MKLATILHAGSQLPEQKMIKSPPCLNYVPKWLKTGHRHAKNVFMGWNLVKIGPKLGPVQNVAAISQSWR